MKNWFYRMQMKAGSDGSRIAENMLSKGLITADIEYAGEQFNNLKKGDIILIHKGAFPLSLVKVKRKVDEEKISEESFGIDYEVEVLSEYEKLSEEEQKLIDLWGNAPPTGTFYKINSGNNTFNRINNWYKIVTKKHEMNNLLELISYKKQVILQGPPGTGKTYTAKDIAEQMLFSKVSDDKKQQKELLETTEQFKLIQFHPAYSYEDFVRGIVAESKGELIEYKTKNKVLADFAAKALLNYTDSRKNTDQLTEENWIQDSFMEFTEFIADKIENNNGRLILEGTTTYLKQVDEDCFRYGGDNWNTTFGNRMHFKDILEMFHQNIKERQDIKKMSGVSGLAKQHASYFMKVLDLFYNFMKDKTKPATAVNQVTEKKFILIIDEINRANLPAVLGELIYALEYRGEKVESMYSIDDDNTLIIPPNLYIIGTMNTSDRSVGHIDYAIRRRFAFIDVLPNVLEGDKFELDLFKQVSALFIQNFDEYVQDNTVELILSEHLSEEFRPEDVWLGHSYFIKNDTDFELRKKFEIVPILKEYVKDGILKQSAEPIISAL